MTATDTVWSRSLADEFWSGSVSPLMFSVSGGLIESRMVAKGLRLARISTDEPFLRYHRGYVYVNTGVLGEVLRFFPSIFLTDGVLAHLPSDLRALLEGRERSFLALFHPRFVATCARTLLEERGWSPFSNHHRFRRQADGLLARAHRGFGDELASEDPASLLRSLERVESEMGDFLEAAIWGVTYAYLLYPLVTTVSERWLDEGEGRVATWAMRRVPGNKTVEVNEAIEDLAEHLRTRPELRDRLETDPERFLRLLAVDDETDDEGHVRDGLHDLLTHHGHRLFGRDLLFPSWREHPRMVLDLVFKATEARTPGDDADRAREPEALGRRRSLDPLRRLLLELGLYYMPRYVHLRENMRYFADLFLARARAIALRLGDGLVERGTLEDRDQVFFLFRDELARAAVGPADPDLATLAESRRADYEDAKTHKPPLRIVGASATDPAPAPAEGEPLLDSPHALTGSGVSRGVVRGRARVVHDVDEFRDVEPGEILITNATDPGWTCLFSVAGGLVMEMGGMLSHGAILAREYELPAVAHIPDATSRIPTGALVEVDGLQGTVRVLEDPDDDPGSDDPAPS